MTKYTREQVIEKLQKLKAGDELVGVKDYYTEGRRYKIEADDFGDLYVIDDGGSRGHVCVDGEYGHAIAREIMNGMLDFIETKKKTYLTPTERLMSTPKFVKDASMLFYKTTIAHTAGQTADGVVELLNSGIPGMTREEKIGMLQDTQRFFNAAFEEAIDEIREASE